MGKLIQQYRGRVEDSPWDNLLAEFASIVGPVDGAVEIQMDLKLKKDELPEPLICKYRFNVINNKIFCKFWAAESNVKKSWLMDVGYPYNPL